MIDSGMIHVGSFFIEVETALMILMLSIASITDIVSRKIPNWLILAGITSSFLYQVLSPYGFGFSTWLAGLSVGLLTLFPLYALRVMGAGDVKLMAAVGSFLGGSAAFSTLIYTLISGGVLALVFILFKRTWKSSFQNVTLIGMHMFSSVLAKRVYLAEYPVQTSGHLPYAVAIFAGTLLHLYVFRG
ncbi:A24 family peptidase [Noviherbaspirillum pedocola]|uniref:Prepilin peptidase n=1 Tax=Noviherbaspirillum pedocola TaxID=2801341 RepID=A0A934W079_9BURK|nr:prepilin peptidase [Noviherbaspirillum pedocola]MBK4733811.1 prepilin peptidase [Noviherbaspirillum pedocola]